MRGRCAYLAIFEGSLVAKIQLERSDKLALLGGGWWRQLGRTIALTTAMLRATQADIQVRVYRGGTC